MDYLTFQRLCASEHEIITKLFKDNQVTCHFDYRMVVNDNVDAPVQKNNIRYILAIATFNPRHLQTFNFFITGEHATRLECLDEAKLYLNKVHQKDSGYFSFQIDWMKNDNEHQKHTSYFYAKNAMEAINKFNEGKNPEDFHISLIRENPIA